MIIAPVGRGRIAKTTLANALYEEMRRRNEFLTAWDLDKAPSLSYHIKDAKLPLSSAPSDRKLALQTAINETVLGAQSTIVDMGADEILFHELNDMLPGMRDILANEGVEVVAIHVIGPEPLKDMAYFNATKDTGVFTRQIVVFSYCVVPRERDPDKAFGRARRLVSGLDFPTFPFRRLPPEVMSVYHGEADGKPKTFEEVDKWLMDARDFWNRAVLTSFIGSSIKPMVDEILGETLPEAA